MGVARHATNRPPRAVERRRRLAPALLIAAVGGLAGCELIAGIHDIALTGDASHDGASSVTVGDAQGDLGPGPSSDAPNGDAMNAGDGLNESDAGPGDAVDSADSRVQGDADGMAVPTDAGPPGDGDAASGDAASGDAADAGLVTELIDNMEAHNGLIPRVNGRDGEWYVFNDGTDGGIETPASGSSFPDFAISPPRGSSMYAVRMYGSGFTGWGAGVGFNINSPTIGPNGGKRLTYDASPYRGFMFYARTLSGATATLAMEVPDHNTDPSGGICTACGDHFFSHVTITASWAQYVVYYTDLKQAGWGRPQKSALDPTQIYGVSFIVASMPFDVWVDDIYFILP
jgi:hypothetical protein